MQAIVGHRLSRVALLKLVESRKDHPDAPTVGQWQAVTSGPGRTLLESVNFHSLPKKWYDLHWYSPSLPPSLSLLLILMKRGTRSNAPSPSLPSPLSRSRRRMRRRRRRASMSHHSAEQSLFAARLTPERCSDSRKGCI